jgi:hypothetical protein
VPLCRRGLIFTATTRRHDGSNFEFLRHLLNLEAIVGRVLIRVIGEIRVLAAVLNTTGSASF